MKTPETTERFDKRVADATLRAAMATTMLTASFTIAGCAQKPDTQGYAYNNVNQCISAGIFTKGTCESMNARALADHRKLAPRYQSRKDCEDDWNSRNDGRRDQRACDQGYVRSGGHSSVVFMPHYYGFYGGNAYNGSGTYSSPVYRSASGYQTLGGNGIASQAFGKAGVATHSSSFSKPSSVSTFSKGSSFKSGGFGSTGRGMSAGG